MKLLWVLLHPWLWLALGVLALSPVIWIVGPLVGDGNPLDAWGNGDFRTNFPHALAMLDANPQGKHGKHDYALEDYGLTRESVYAHFGDYIERFGIPVKG